MEIGSQTVRAGSWMNPATYKCFGRIGETSDFDASQGICDLIVWYLRDTEDQIHFLQSKCWKNWGNGCYLKGQILSHCERVVHINHKACQDVVELKFVRPVDLVAKRAAVLEHRVEFVHSWRVQV